MRPIALIVSALVLGIVATTQLEGRASGTERFVDHATAAAIPVAEDYVAFALVEGDCKPAYELTILDAATIDAFCRLARQSRSGEWRARPGVLRRGCALRDDLYEVIGRYDCVGIRMNGRDCSGTIDGRAALTLPKEDIRVFMQSRDDGVWRVADASVGQIGLRPSAPIRPCTREEVLALEPGLPSRP
jgi:hypothetical protein